MGDYDYVEIVFDGPPGPVCGRFVEVEDSNGKGIRLGEWVTREDGYDCLRIIDPRPLARRIADLEAKQLGRLDPKKVLEISLAKDATIEELEAEVEDLKTLITGHCALETGKCDHSDNPGDCLTEVSFKIREQSATIKLLRGLLRECMVYDGKTGTDAMVLSSRIKAALEEENDGPTS